MNFQPKRGMELQHTRTRKSSLKQEAQLETQILLRQALEKELIREISVLELQVVNLESCLLSLHKQRCSYNRTEYSPASPEDVGVMVSRDEEDSRSFRRPKKYNVVERCYSSISSHHSTAAVSRAIGSCHYSLPLSMLEDGTFGGMEMMVMSPNWVSEEMVKCISTIYIELSQPSSSNLGGSSSSCQLMSEVRWMNMDSLKLQDVHHKMHHFRSLVSRLESVEPGEMKHGEQLAFWINVHNSLVMHAFLVYGIPRNHARRMSLALKAACNVGGQTVSVETIQSSILGCHLPRPRQQWLGALFHPWRKQKTNIPDSRNPYSVNTHEPRLYFALCTGNHSDPPLRAYAPETVFSDLEAAKQEYIQTSLVPNRKGKKQRSSSNVLVLYLPKIVELFAKDSKLGDQSALIETEILDHLGDVLPVSVRSMIIRWVPHSFEFRYLISRDFS
ncbi:hypothetical protein LINGRAHAP2_LOCUS26043 [Linum grandiflorum]